MCRSSAAISSGGSRSTCRWSAMCRSRPCPRATSPTRARSTIRRCSHAVDRLGYGSWIGCEYRPRATHRGRARLGARLRRRAARAIVRIMDVIVRVLDRPRPLSHFARTKGTPNSPYSGPVYREERDEELFGTEPSRGDAGAAGRGSAASRRAGERLSEPPDQADRAGAAGLRRRRREPQRRRADVGVDGRPDRHGLSSRARAPWSAARRSRSRRRTATRS